MDYFRIGLFLRPHGIKGELKLLPLTDDLKRFARLSDAFIEAPEGVYQTVTVESARVAAENSVIIKLKGIDTVEAAEKLRRALEFPFTGIATVSVTDVEKMLAHVESEI